MDKSQEDVLAKVSPDRRRFVQTILGLAGYGSPVVRSFIMASAITPIVSATGTTTAAPTTTRNAWRPTVRPTLTQSQPLINPVPPSGAGMVIHHESEASGSLLKPHTNRPGIKKP